MPRPPRRLRVELLEDRVTPAEGLNSLTLGSTSGSGTPNLLASVPVLLAAGTGQRLTMLSPPDVAYQTLYALSFNPAYQLDPLFNQTPWSDPRDWSTATYKDWYSRAWGKYGPRQAAAVTAPVSYTQTEE